MHGNVSIMGQEYTQSKQKNTLIILSNKLSLHMVVSYGSLKKGTAMLQNTEMDFGEGQYVDLEEKDEKGDNNNKECKHTIVDDLKKTC